MARKKGGLVEFAVIDCPCLKKGRLDVLPSMTLVLYVQWLVFRKDGATTAGQWAQETAQYVSQSGFLAVFDRGKAERQQAFVKEILRQTMKVRRMYHRMCLNPSHDRSQTYATSCMLDTQTASHVSPNCMSMGTAAYAVHALASCLWLSEWCTRRGLPTYTPATGCTRVWALHQSSSTPQTPAAAAR